MSTLSNQQYQMTYITPFQYAKENGVKASSVYRWIRERKFDDSEVIIEKKEVFRIKVLQSAKPVVKVRPESMGFRKVKK